MTLIPRLYPQVLTSPPNKTTQALARFSGAYTPLTPDEILAKMEASKAKTLDTGLLTLGDQSFTGRHILQMLDEVTSNLTRWQRLWSQNWISHSTLFHGLNPQQDWQADKLIRALEKADYIKVDVIPPSKCYQMTEHGRRVLTEKRFPGNVYHVFQRQKEKTRHALVSQLMTQVCFEDSQGCYTGKEFLQRLHQRLSQQSWMDRFLYNGLIPESDVLDSPNAHQRARNFDNILRMQEAGLIEYDFRKAYRITPAGVQEAQH